MMNAETEIKLLKEELAFVKESATAWEKSCKEAYQAQERLSNRDDEQQAEIATLRNALKECVGVMEDMPHNELCEILQWWTSVNPPRWGDCTCGRAAARAAARASAKSILNPL